MAVTRSLITHTTRLIAGEAVRVNISGNLIHYRSGGGNVDVSFQSAGSKATLSAGSKINTDGVYNTVYLTSAATGDYIFNFGFGDIEDIVDSGSASGFTHGSVAATTTATLIASASSSRRALTVQNLGPQAIFIGDSGVTTSNGFELFVNDTLELKNQGAVYAIASVSTSDVRYFDES